MGVSTGDNLSLFEQLNKAYVRSQQKAELDSKVEAAFDRRRRRRTALRGARTFIPFLTFSRAQTWTANYDTNDYMQ
jgi:hypothetical protein